MISFLRRVRMSLIESGSGRKYMLYAMGEVALMVIGILIALQINNWNEGQKSIAKGKQVLTSLSEDFAANLTELEKSLKQIDRVIESQRKKLSYSGMNDSELTEEMKRAIGHTVFEISDIVDGTMNSVLNSDKLELIAMRF